MYTYHSLRHYSSEPRRFAYSLNMRFAILIAINYLIIFYYFRRFESQGLMHYFQNTLAVIVSLILVCSYPCVVNAAENSDISTIRSAAEKGDVSAQGKLGIMYYQGKGVPQDNAEAAKWTQKAAEQGNMYAESLLGIMYVNGEGVPQNNLEAAKWYQKAAD